MRLPVAEGMTKAELKYWEVPKNCAGVLVLCPGWNGDGGHWIKNAGWREFARKHNFALVGLSFVSPDGHEAEPMAYHHAEKGSGKLLFEGLEKIMGGGSGVGKTGAEGGAEKSAAGRDGRMAPPPVILFGFSRGGQFAMSVAEHFPDKVRAWGATGAAGVPPEKKILEGVADAKMAPPGVVICGLDDSNAGAATENFLARLRLRRRVCWLGVPGVEHAVNARAEVWTRAFFDAVLANPVDAKGIWVEGEFGRGLDGFLLRVWFPDENTKKTWDVF
ncbi:MAG: hypothetical protein LBG65_07935 [Puniceicoccales bacterium]|nr:hypothetical protein [Puniceicoccales bacterium]